nr:hypothetical protein [Glycomyces sambucus]
MLVGVDVELGEAGLYEAALALVGQAAVEPSGVVQEFEQGVHGLPRLDHRGRVGAFEFAVDPDELIAEVAHLGVEEVLRPVPDEIEELTPLLRDPGALLAELAPHLLAELGRVLHAGLDRGPCGGDERLAELQCREVVGDSHIHLLGAKTREIAGAIADAEADEVEVHDAALVLAAIKIDPAAAAPAAQPGLERMVVHALAGPGSGASLQERLDSIEDHLADEGDMASGVLAALVRDVPEVVAIAQDLVDLVVRDRPPGRVLLGRT